MENRIKGIALANLLRARHEWDSLLARVEERELNSPDVCGRWSVKDIIAHISWYEREMVGMLTSLSLEGSPLWELPTDERNAAIFRENQFKSLDDVLLQYRKVFADLLAAVETVEPNVLLNPSYIKGMPEDWDPMLILAGNTWGHYPQHAGHIEALLERTG